MESRIQDRGHGLTVTVYVAMLCAGIGSCGEEVTTAVFVNEVPAAETGTVTVIVTRATPGAAMGPRLAVTVPVAPTAGELQVPWLGVAEMIV